MTHAALSDVLAGGFPLPGQDLDPRRLQVLRGYLAVLAQGGPETTPELFPDQAHVIAYYLNAHIAWAHALGAAPDLKSRSIGAIEDTPVRLDRRTTSLRGIAARAIQESVGEPRILLFLNPGWRGGPRLSPSAVEGYSLTWQLAEQGRRVGSTAGFWALEEGARQVRVSSLVEELPALPAEPRLRARRALDLVPPPDPLRARILATCGEQLGRCTVLWIPVDRVHILKTGSRLKAPDAHQAQGSRLPHPPVKGTCLGWVGGTSSLEPVASIRSQGLCGGVARAPSSWPGSCGKPGVEGWVPVFQALWEGGGWGVGGRLSTGRQLPGRVRWGAGGRRGAAFRSLRRCLRPHVPVCPPPCSRDRGDWQ